MVSLEGVASITKPLLYQLSYGGNCFIYSYLRLLGRFVASKRQP